MSGTQSQRIRPGFGGWATEPAPDYVPETQAPLVQNLLCRTGKLTMRGPIHHASGDLGFAADARTLAVMYAGGDYALISPDTGDLRRVLLGPAGVGVGAAIATTGLNRPNGRSVAYGGYGWGSGDTGRLLRWDGTAAAPTSYTEPNAPNGFADIDVFAERLFVAGGTVNGSGAPNRLLFSDAGGPTAGTVADWTDDVSGLVNQITVGGPDPIVAIRAVGRQLVVFKRAAMFVLTGTGSSTFNVREISGSVGSLDVWSVVVVDDAVYFLSDTGYCCWDSASTRVASLPIAPDMSEAIQRTLVATGCRVSAGLVRDGAILVTATNTGPFSGTAPRVAYLQALYDTQRRTWSAFTCGAIAQPVSMMLRIGASNHTLATDGDKVFYISDIACTNVHSSGAAANLRDVIDGTTAAINAKWHSRLVKLDSPLNASQLQRLLLDSRMDIGADVPGWFVSLLRGDGTAAMAEVQVPGEAAGAPTYLARRRYTTEIHGEATDVQLRVEWRDSTAAMTVAEIYDATIAFQATHQRGSA